MLMLAPSFHLQRALSSALVLVGLGLVSGAVVPTPITTVAMTAVPAERMASGIRVPAGIGRRDQCGFGPVLPPGFRPHSPVLHLGAFVVPDPVQRHVLRGGSLSTVPIRERMGEPVAHIDIATSVAIAERFHRRHSGGAVRHCNTGCRVLAVPDISAMHTAALTPAGRLPTISPSACG